MRFRTPSVFKTELDPVQLTFHDWSRMWDSNPRNPGPKPGGIAANRTRDKIGGGPENRTLVVIQGASPYRSPLLPPIDWLCS